MTHDRNQYQGKKTIGYEESIRLAADTLGVSLEEAERLLIDAVAQSHLSVVVQLDDGIQTMVTGKTALEIGGVETNGAEIHAEQKTPRR
jgi:hypothetical protein